MAPRISSTVPPSVAARSRGLSSTLESPEALAITYPQTANTAKPAPYMLPV